MWNPPGDKQFALRDPNKSKDLLGRLGIDSKIEAGAREADGGLSSKRCGAPGFHAGSAPTKDTLVWHDTNLDGQVDPTELTGVLGMPGLPSEGFGRWGFGGDLRLTAELPRLGELALHGDGGGRTTSTAPSIQPIPWPRDETRASWAGISR